MGHSSAGTLGLHQLGGLEEHEGDLHDDLGGKLHGQPWRACDLSLRAESQLEAGHRKLIVEIWKVL